VIDANKLAHFAKGAISRLLEEAARMADSNEKITSIRSPIALLMREAAMYADEAGRMLVEREDVERAITETQESESLYRDGLYNAKADGTFMVDVQGRKKDTINAVAVIGGDFGALSRVSVKTYAGGKGDIVVSTEERADIVGSSFKQSIGNVSAFFRGMIGRTHALPFQASVKFEQNYGGIDGDSATQAMIYLIGASLADVAIPQNFSFTGSADQHGNVQVIGGLNQKIEGSWDIYREIMRRQGKPLSTEDPFKFVLPAANIRDLALRPDVAQAVKDGTLVLIPVVHVSQGFEAVFGIPYSTFVSRWKAYRESVIEANREKKDEPKAPNS
jgi:predicted ATP-dependent protease